VTILYSALALVAVQRGAELVVAARNTSRLRARGAVEADAAGYPLFVLLHAAWLVSLAVLVPAATAPSWPLLGAFALLQGLRIWIVVSLGGYWTMRVLSVPDAPLVRTGPYRFLRHPNYAVVAGEIAILPVAFGALAIAVVFSVLNLALLARRIRIEERMLLPRRQV
jgi:methyltransferase